jgi:hypothetical protein
LLSDEQMPSCNLLHHHMLLSPLLVSFSPYQDC